ncbi:MAG: hypothetical protein ACTS3T_02845 [Almyronema sp.]
MAVSTPDALIWLRHRDPRRLWPKLIALAVLLHGLLWLLGWPIWLRSQQALTQSTQTVVPIELVATAEGASSEAIAAAGSAEEATAAAATESAASPDSQANQSASPSPSPNATEPPSDRSPAVVSGNETSGTSPERGGSTAAGNTRNSSNTGATGNDQGGTSASGGDRGRQTQEETTAGGSSAATGRETEGTEGTEGTTGDGAEVTEEATGNEDGLGTVSVNSNPTGQNTRFTTQLAVAPLPDGNDIPDILPALVNEGRQQIVLDPLQGTCDLPSPEVTQFIQTGASVALQVVVEADGRVSGAFVKNTSGSFGFDTLMRCLLVEAQVFEFYPAQSGGAAVPTDQIILQVSVTPN